jgi:protein SCO1/2
MPRAPQGTALIAIAVGGALVLTGCSASSASTAPVAVSSSHAWHGVEPEPVPDRPSFVLTDTGGQAFDFAAETAGQPTLVYFGYTNCPDECPTAMADIAAALRTVPASLREQVKVVLVTTDPARDTGPVLRSWLDQFSSEFIGLRGTAAQVDAAQIAAGIQPAQQEGPVPTLPGKPNEHVHRPGTVPHTHTGPLGYGVGHANTIFAYSADDRLPVVYPSGVRPSDIAADLPALAVTSKDR